MSGLFKKRGGGFLNGVDGVIKDYQFTDEFNGNAPKAGAFHSLYVVLSVLVDGATEPVTTTLFAGGADDFEISDDGHTLTPNKDGYQLGGGTAFSTFIESMLAAEPKVEDMLTPYDYTGMIGARARFVQQPYDADQIARLKRAGKATTRKDAKTGKEYPYTDLVIDQVYEVAAPKAKGSVKGKAAAKDSGARELADATLLDIVAKAPGQTITKAKLTVQILKRLAKDPQCEAVRTLLTKDEVLGSVDGVDYDSETEVLTLAA